MPLFNLVPHVIESVGQSQSQNWDFIPSKALNCGKTAICPAAAICLFILSRQKTGLCSNVG